MPKQMNTNLKFTTSTDASEIGDNYNDDTTTTGIGGYSKTFTFPDYNYNNCPHMLPCGDCAITMRPCHHNWGKWEITCSYEGC